MQPRVEFRIHDGYLEVAIDGEIRATIEDVPIGQLGSELASWTASVNDATPEPFIFSGGMKPELLGVFRIEPRPVGWQFTSTVERSRHMPLPLKEFVAAAKSFCWVSSAALAPLFRFGDSGSPPEPEQRPARFDTPPQTRATRLLLAIPLFMIWAASSAVLGFLSLFAVSQMAMVICAVTALACICVALFLLANSRVLSAFAVAAAPGLLPLILLEISSFLRL